MTPGAREIEGKARGFLVLTKLCSVCRRRMPVAGGSGSRKPWRCSNCKPKPTKEAA